MANRDILIEEDLEIATTTGTAPLTLSLKVLALFPAFAHRNFQLYIFGQAISLVGFWLQQVALGWLIFQLTRSVFWVGTIAAIGGLPFLIFTTFAGVFIDKVNKRKLLIITQMLEAALAIATGFLVITHQATLTNIAILVFVNGLIAAVDLPTRLTFIVEMVGKRDLASAIPINNGLFNAARFIGPALAGALIASWGLAWPFFLNGVSFIAGIWAIVNIKPIYQYQADEKTHPLESLKVGIKFAFTHPKILYFMILAFTTAIFIWPFQTLMPFIADSVYSAGAKGLGSLLSAAGAGSLLGAVTTSALSKTPNKSKQIIWGLVIAAVSFILFAINRNFPIAHLLLFTAGFGLLMMVSTLNTLVQLLTPDQMRARVMAVYLTMFVGMMPLGNQLAGIIAEYTSAMFTIGLGAILMLTVGIALYMRGVFTNLSD